MVGWVGFQEGWREYETDYVRFELPRGMNCGPLSTPPELTAMTICRGVFAPGSPAAIIVSTRPERAPGAIKGERIEVPGARDAHRFHNEMHVEEGLAFDYLERVDVVVAKRKHDFVTLSVRTIASDGHNRIIDRVIDSIVVRG